MTDLSRNELVGLVEECDLFEEYFQVAGAQRYRQAFAQARGWRLQRGEFLPRGEMTGAAYVVLDGEVVDYDPQRTVSANEQPTLRVFGQWNGLRGLRPDENPMARSAAVVVECKPELLKLLGEVASGFQVAFYKPLVASIEVVSDTPEEALEQIIRQTRFRTYRAGESIVRAGDYGSTMFFILAGAARTGSTGGAEVVMERGRFFGEIALLSYQPRVSTVVSEDGCLTMECNRIAFGELRKKSKTFKEIIEKLYRERALDALLASNALFKDLEPAERKLLAQIATLETYDPYEPVFFQGEKADAFYVVLNGTLTVVEERGDGSMPITWVESGGSIGELGLMPEISGSDRRGATVTALQRVDAVKFTAADFNKLLEDNRFIRTKISKIALERYQQHQSIAVDASRATRLGWIFETEHLAGNWVLAVDMNDCIRCGNCVSACENTHADGISRFFWTDMRQSEDVLPAVRLSNSCQHCEFALCMSVCPSGCIERLDQQATVYIDYTRCIKCGKCADPSQGCPYGSIHITPTEEVNPQASVPLLVQIKQWFSKKPAAAPTGEEKKDKQGSRYPVKCDLCYTLPEQSCVKHCPTGAVFRVEGGKQFESAMKSPSRVGASANRPSGDQMPLYLRASFEHGMQAKKPGELKIHVSTDRKAGQPIFCRKPEAGVNEFKLNLYLVAPDDWRIGGKNLRQFKLGVDDLAGEDKYPITAPAAGKFDLTLAAYQGGLYLGRIKVPCEVEPAAPPAPRPAPAAAKPAGAAAQPAAGAAPAPTPGAAPAPTAGEARPARTKVPKTLPPKPPAAG